MTTLLGRRWDARGRPRRPGFRVTATESVAVTESVAESVNVNVNVTLIALP